MRKVGSLAVAVVAALSAAAAADVVKTTTGASYEGKVLSQDDREVVIETTFDGVKRVPRAEVASVDTLTPPLREQYRFRFEGAKDDAAKLWDLHRWAKEKGFTKEPEDVLLRIVEVTPEDKRARKLLGHEKVDGAWMTPEQKAKHLEAKHEEEMKAKGLVLHEGAWVTPEEKAAREKGLLKDGPDWVTEEEFHRRRGEEKKGGAWVKVGEAEGQAYAAAATAAVGARLEYVWTPHFDVLHDGMAENAKKVAEASEAAFDLFRGVLRPKGDDFPETVGARTRILLFKKQPAYARYVKWFDETAKASSVVPNWGTQVSKQHAFWWTHPEHVIGVYQFPNTDKTLVSNAIHQVGLQLLTRYKLNYLFPSPWLNEGFAYWLEMEVLKYTESFTLGRPAGATVAADGSSVAPAWSDSAKWRPALTTLVAEGRDPPLKRLASMDGSQMGYEELVKSWSVVEYLIRADPAKFKAFVDATKKRGADEEAALTAGVGGDFRAVEQRWRAWVSGGFPNP